VKPGSPGFRGYVDAGALELYCERHGDGHPLVLLHGAFGTIESCFADLVPALARNFEVIAVEFQGHGHTRDIGRPLAHHDMAADLAVLLELDRSGVPSWPRARLEALQAPTLLINDDSDIVRPEHAVQMFRLLGGGGPGGPALAGTRPAQLALLPGTSHEGILDRPECLSAMITPFLLPLPLS
jgi:pimeloyl-ACP methyl ester carboxylesterase